MLLAPRSVFASLRDDSDESAEARQDVVGGLVWLAGISGILATSVASHIRDDFEIDGTLTAVWAFLAGGLYGFFLYYVLGKVSQVSLRKLGSRGSFRRARHLLAFAATPIALALFVYWPFRIIVYGIDLFRTGGPDGRGAGEVTAFIFYGFAIWALVLFVIGVRTVHGWTWARSVAGVALTAAFATALALVVGVLYAL